MFGRGVLLLSMPLGWLPSGMLCYHTSPFRLAEGIATFLRWVFEGDCSNWGQTGMLGKGRDVYGGAAILVSQDEVLLQLQHCRKPADWELDKISPRLGWRGVVRSSESAKYNMQDKK